MRLDSDQLILEIQATKPQSGLPNILVYSAPTHSGWSFDLDRTLQANRGIRIIPFPSNVALETRYWARPRGTIMPYFKNPDELGEVSDARVVLTRRLPIEATVWRSDYQIPAELQEKPQERFEYRGAYGDPDSEWCTIYTRPFYRRGGHDARFVRIGEWIKIGEFVGSWSPSSRPLAGFIHVVKTDRLESP